MKIISLFFMICCLIGCKNRGTVDNYISSINEPGKKEEEKSPTCGDKYSWTLVLAVSSRDYTDINRMADFYGYATFGGIDNLNRTNCSLVAGQLNQYLKNYQRLGRREYYCIPTK